MDISEFKAVQVMAALPEDNIPATLQLLQNAIDGCYSVDSAAVHDELYTHIMFHDHSVLAFRWKDAGATASLECFVMFAYQNKREIPDCVTENPEMIGTCRFAILPPTPETLQ